MLLIRAASITWALASERGLGPGNLDFVLVYRLGAISQGPKKSRFPGTNIPLPLALVMNAIPSKAV